MACALDSRSCHYAPDGDAADDRWERLLEENDEAQLWRAIDWRSEVNHTVIRQE